MNKFMREAKKALAAASAAATVGVTAGLVTGQAAVWVIGGITAATAFVVTYLAPPNETL